MSEKRAGFVAIIGLPNSGKSTLMNFFLGTELSIVTPKAQTTRQNILGIYTKENIQVIFLDTPGLLEPKYKLQEYMLEQAWLSLQDADIIFFMHDCTKDFNAFEEEVIAKIKEQYCVKKNIPLVILLNKIDLLDKKKVEEIKDKLEKNYNLNIIPISLLENDNLQLIFEFLEKNLPIHDFYYSEEELSDRPLRFFVAEIIRKHLFLNLEEEVPYSTTVTIEEFNENVMPYNIRAYIYVERDSQKGIVIGKNGEMIKKIRQASTKEIYRTLGIRVKLDIWVKVMENWRKKENKIKYFGYN